MCPANRGDSIQGSGDTEPAIVVCASPLKEKTLRSSGASIPFPLFIDHIPRPPGSPSALTLVTTFGYTLQAFVCLFDLLHRCLVFQGGEVTHALP